MYLFPRVARPNLSDPFVYTAPDQLILVLSYSWGVTPGILLAFPNRFCNQDLCNGTYFELGMDILVQNWHRRAGDLVLWIGGSAIGLFSSTVCDQKWRHWAIFLNTLWSEIPPLGYFSEHFVIGNGTNRLFFPQRFTIGNVISGLFSQHFLIGNCALFFFHDTLKTGSGLICT